MFDFPQFPLNDFPISGSSDSLPYNSITQDLHKKTLFDNSSESNSLSEPIPNKGKNKRTRKNANKKVASLFSIEAEDKKAMRAEKNRQFAKESRERRRKYVQNLEQEVNQLKEEIESYKIRLKKYELIEKFKTPIGFELYDTIVSIYKEMHDNNEPVTNQNLFVEA